jgi:hypothetical protein
VVVVRRGVMLVGPRSMVSLKVCMGLDPAWVRGNRDKVYMGLVLA